MRKIFYAGLLAVAASGIAIAQLATAPAQQAVAPPAVTAAGDVDYSVLQPLAPELNVNLSINFDTRKMVPEITLTAPMQARDQDNWSLKYDMASFTKMVLTRQLGYSGEEVEIKEWNDVTAGQVLNYSDEDPSLENGKRYTYNIRAYNGEVEGSVGYKSITIGLEPTTPDSPVARSNNGFAPVAVSYTCPGLTTGGGYYDDPEPMPDGVTYTKIVLTKQNPDGTKVELDVQLNPEPGKTYSVTDTDETQGSRRYSVQTFTDFGNSEESYATTVYIGEDYPSAVTDLQAREVDGKVELTWTAPDKGYNNGHFDPSKVYYTVYRMKNNYDNDPELIGNKIKECSFVDDLANVTEEREVYYRVHADNGVEIPANVRHPYTDTRTPLVVGPAGKLPFFETFNSGSKYSKTFDKRWTENFPSYGGFNSHYVMNERWFYYGENEDEVTIIAGTGGGTGADELGPDAYYYVNASSWSTDKEPGYLETGKLDFSDVSKPMLSFYYIPIKGSCGSIDIEVTTGETDSEGAPIYKKAGRLLIDSEYQMPQADSEPEAAPAAGEGAETPKFEWTKVEYPLSQFAGKDYVKVRFGFRYNADDTDSRYPFFFDQVSVKDYPGVTGLEYKVTDDNDMVLTWSMPEGVSTEGMKYNVYFNGAETPVATVETPTYTHKGIRQGLSYSFTVEPVYADGQTGKVSEPAVYDAPIYSMELDGVTYMLDVAESTAIAYSYNGTAENLTIPAEVKYEVSEDKSFIFNVVQINSGVFSGVRSLKNVDIKADITALADETFYGCAALESVKLPAGVTAIGDKAFFGCAALNGIEFPAALETIGASAFEHCSKIAEITIGKNVTEIGARAFAGCSSLGKVTFEPVVPPTVGENAFQGVKNPCEGVCPEGSLDEYLKVEALKPITFPSSGISLIFGADVREVEYFDYAGNKIAEPAPGRPVVVRVTYIDGKVRTARIIVRK